MSKENNKNDSKKGNSLFPQKEERDFPLNFGVDKYHRRNSMDKPSFTILPKEDESADTKKKK